MLLRKCAVVVFFLPCRGYVPGMKLSLLWKLGESDTEVSDVSATLARAQCTWGRYLCIVRTSSTRRALLLLFAIPVSDETARDKTWLSS